MMYIYVYIYTHTHLQATNTLPAVDQERRWINLSGACRSEPTGCETRVPVAHRRPPGCGSVTQNWRGRTWATKNGENKGAKFECLAVGCFFF